MRRFQLFLALSTVSFSISLLSNAATVTSLNEVTAVNLGIITPGTEVGSISTDGRTTGGVKSLGGIAVGSITVNAQNTTNTDGRKIKIFVISKQPKIGGAIIIPTITSSLPSDCIKDSNNAMICTNPNNTVDNVKTWTIPVNATMANIPTYQSGEDYYSSYNIIACSCVSNGCPNNISDYRCTDHALGKTFSGTIPATMYKSLSVVSDAELSFGSVSPSEVAGSTIDQDGNVTGGAASIGGKLSAGTFKVSGEPNNGTQYSFILPESVTLKNTGNAPDMTARLLYSAGTTGSRALNASGQDIVTINGILTMGARAAQTAGEYVGTYGITVNY